MAGIWCSLSTKSIGVAAVTQNTEGHDDYFLEPAFYFYHFLHSTVCCIMGSSLTSMLRVRLNFLLKLLLVILVVNEKPITCLIIEGLILKMVSTFDIPAQMLLFQCFNHRLNCFFLSRHLSLPSKKSANRPLGSFS